MKISLKQYPDVYGLRGYEAKKKVVLVPKVRKVIVQPKIASTATPTPKRITEGVDCTTPYNESTKYSLENTASKLAGNLRKPDAANLLKTDPGGYDSHINGYNRFKCADPAAPTPPQVKFH